MKKNLYLKSLVQRVVDRRQRKTEQSVESAKRLSIEALEPRILFSVAPAPAPAPEPAPVAEEAPAPAPTESVAPTSEVGTAAVIAIPPAASEPAGEAAAGDQGVTRVTLTGPEVTAVAEAAAQRWVDSGISAEQAAALDAISYQVADLGGNHLGVANGSAITVDDDAAGTGSWFIDSTPDDDDEFVSGAAPAGFDLLSVILHEQGHVLGLADSRGSGGLMDSVLGEGARRLPIAGQADGAIPGSNLSASYISAPNFSPLTFDFDTFTGAGFDPAPAAGQLDSNDWSVTGFSQAPGSVPFGGSESTGDFARGSSTGSVSTGGVYSFDIGAGDNVFGVQPAGSDFTPGTITLQIQNNTGGTVSEWEVGYDVAVFNDKDRANSFDLQVAIGTMDTPGVFVPVAGYELTTPGTADGVPAWASTTMSGTVNATVADGDYVFLQWLSNDSSGAGSRDEFGLNNLSVQAVEPPASPTVVISEIMYDPSSGEPDWEWVEVANTGTEVLNLSGWVIDDGNGTSHGSANIASGAIAAGGTGVLFNADEITAADFEAAWGSGINLIGVTGWTSSTMGLNNSGGDTVGLWNSFASYSGDHATQANAIVSVTYPDLGVGASVFLSDLTDQSTFALSADGTPTPAGGAAYLSLAAGGNVGGEAGSPLEPVAFDTGVSIDGGGTLIIEDVEAANDDNLTISSDGTNLMVKDVTNVLGHSILGAMSSRPGTVIVPLALFDDIIIRTNGGTDSIRVNSLTGIDQSLTVDGGDGSDFIDFRAAVSGAAGESYDFDAERILFYLDSSIAATGAGTIDIDSTGGAGDFIGVQLKRASLSTGTGSISIDGVGGATGKTNDGVLLSHGSSVSTMGGGVTIYGTAGGSVGASDGVSLLGGSDVSTTGSGEITITGTSNGVNDSYGVQLFTGTEVSTVDGDVSITGSGTGTGARNSGIYTNKATVTTTGIGSIALTGTGSGAGSSSKGLRLTDTDIAASGSGAVTLTGTGGGSTSRNVGVQVGVRSTVTTASGDVSITGIGNGEGNGNTGVSFGSKAAVSGGGAVTITGTGGLGTANNDGVTLLAATVTATGIGDITITGIGGGLGSSNRGFESTRSTISGGANVTVTGTGSLGSTSGRFNDGINFDASTATSVGTLTFAGTGGTGSAGNRGFGATGSTITAGTTFDIDGIANVATTGTRNHGVSIGYTTLSAAGAIDGTGTGVGSPNYGVRMENIITGLPQASVTGVANTIADNTHGDYFSILPILPILMAEADRRQRKGGKADRDENDGQNGALGALFARMGEVGLLGSDPNGTPVFRILHGQVDPITVNGSDADLELALGESGFEVPGSPSGTRRILVLDGDDDGPLSGFFAFLSEGGEFESSAPLEGSGDMTIGEFLERANAVGSGQLRWSCHNMDSRDSAPAMTSPPLWETSETG